MTLFLIFSKFDDLDTLLVSFCEFVLSIKIYEVIINQKKANYVYRRDRKI